MNIRLSCVCDRVSRRNFYIVEQNGYLVSSSVYPLLGDNIKKNALNAVERGLRCVKQVASHEDLIVIEIQNRHLADWISGRKESKGYELELDSVFEVLESIDSRYMVKFLPCPTAKAVLKDRGIDTPKVTGVDFMNDLEDREV